MGLSLSNISCMTPRLHRWACACNGHVVMGGCAHALAPSCAQCSAGAPRSAGASFCSSVSLCLGFGFLHFPWPKERRCCVHEGVGHGPKPPFYTIHAVISTHLPQWAGRWSMPNGRVKRCVLIFGGELEPTQHWGAGLERGIP